MAQRGGGCKACRHHIHLIIYMIHHIHIYRYIIYIIYKLAGILFAQLGRFS